MRQRVRLDLGQKVTSDKEKERFERKKQRWAQVNRRKDTLDNPFIKAVSPVVDAYGDPNETEEDLRDRLAKFEFGNFPGYFNYRNKAKPAKINQSSDLSTLTSIDKAHDLTEGGDIDDQADKLDTKVQQCDGTDQDEPRNAQSISDERIAHFKEDWIKGKTVLDIGCNRGHITYALARQFLPNCIVGVDIDPKMIMMANRDIHLHLNEALIEARRSSRLKLIELVANYEETSNANLIEKSDDNRGKQNVIGAKAESCDDHNDPCISAPKDHNQRPSERVLVNSSQQRRPEQQQQQQQEFPISNYIDHGSIVLTNSNSDNVFPNNLIFVEHNYVPSNDDLALKQKPHFDTIICLSVTKWIHLNYRDEGLKRFFKRAFNHLNPGGLFILEAQPFDNYARRKRTSDRLKANFYSIQLKPEQFDNYLLSQEVGFREIIYDSKTNHDCKGFERPFKVFLK